MSELLDPSMVEQLTHRALFSRNNQHVFALDQSKRQSKLWRSSKQESTVARKTTSAHQSGSTVLAYLLTRACTACDPSRNCALASLAGAQLGWCAAWLALRSALPACPPIRLSACGSTPTQAGPCGRLPELPLPQPSSLSDALLVRATEIEGG